MKKKMYEERAAKKEAIIAKQKGFIDVIEQVSKYLNKKLEENTNEWFKLDSVLTAIEDEFGIPVEESRKVSQYTHIIVELANARRNRFISDSDCNIRVAYIHTRCYNAFKKELHDDLETIFNTNPALYLMCPCGGCEDGCCDKSNEEVVPAE